MNPWRFPFVSPETANPAENGHTNEDAGLRQARPAKPAAGPLGRFAAALAERAVGRPVAGLAAAVDALAGPLPDGPRRADGTRAATLTAVGVPMEASVTGRGHLEPMVRVAIEPGTAVPFFGPRVAALAAAIDTVTEQLGVAPALAGEMGALVPTVYPDPSVVPARTADLAGSVGVVHHAAVEGLAGIKAYAHLRPDPSAADRVAARWPEVGELLVPFDERWARHAVAFDADIRGRLTRKAYVRSTRPLGHDDLVAAGEAVVPGSGWVVDRLERAGAAGRIGRSGVFLCRTVVGPGAPPVATLYWGVHARRWADDAESFLRALARDLLGSEQAVDALTGAGAATGLPWTFTIVGVGLVPEGEAPKFNLYGCPTVV